MIRAPTGHLGPPRPQGCCRSREEWEPVNSFAGLLRELPDELTRTCLLAVCVGNPVSLSDIEGALQASSMQAHLQCLLDLGLVVSRNDRWEPTWSGWGVYYWIHQLHWADAMPHAELPAPRQQENGDQVVLGCNDYRPLYCRPGYCWCGLLRNQHASEAPQTAALYLAHEREKKRKMALENPSGRSIPEIHQQLDEDLLAALQSMHNRGDGILVAELKKALTGRQTGEELLRRLAERELVLADHSGYWYLTFDGVGVGNWSQQLLHPAPWPEPRFGENGDRIAVRPCAQYRAFLPEPGYCWCGYHQAEHPAPG